MTKPNLLEMGSSFVAAGSAALGRMTQGKHFIAASAVALGLAVGAFAPTEVSARTASGARNFADALSSGIEAASTAKATLAPVVPIARGRGNFNPQLNS